MTRTVSPSPEQNVLILGAEQPKRIWLTCYYHGGDICWTSEPKPDDTDETETVEYVRADALQSAQAAATIAQRRVEDALAILSDTSKAAILRVVDARAALKGNQP